MKISIPVLALCLCATLMPSAVSAHGPKPSLQITRIEVNTHGGKISRIANGATVRSCASEPAYGISFTFRWARMKEPGSERISFDGPGTRVDRRSHGVLFETHGTNGYTTSADEFEADSTALPEGDYRLTVKLDGVTRSVSVKIQGSSC